MTLHSTNHDASIDITLIENIKRYDKGALHQLFTRYRSHLICEAFEILEKRTTVELVLKNAKEIVLEVFHELWLDRQNLNPRVDIYQKLKKHVRAKCTHIKLR